MPPLTPYLRFGIAQGFEQGRDLTSGGMSVTLIRPAEASFRASGSASLRPARNAATACGG